MCNRSYEPFRQLLQEEALGVTDSIAHFAGIRNTWLPGGNGMEFRDCGVGVRGVTGPGECGGCSWTKRQKSFARPGKTIPMAFLRSAQIGRSFFL